MSSDQDFIRVYRLFKKPHISRRLETKANQLQTIPHLHVSRECGRETIFDSMNTPQLLSLCFVMPGDRPDEFNWSASRYALCRARQTVIFSQVAEGSNFHVLDTTGNCLFSTNHDPQLLSQACSIAYHRQIILSWIEGANMRTQNQGPPPQKLMFGILNNLHPLVSLAPSDLHNPSKAESSDQHPTWAAQLMSQSLDHGVPLLPAVSARIVPFS